MKVLYRVVIKTHPYCEVCRYVAEDGQGNLIIYRRTEYYNKHGELTSVSPASKIRKIKL